MIHIIQYDQASGLEGVRAIAQKYQQGWFALENLRYHPCCGLYRIVFQWPKPTPPPHPNTLNLDVPLH